MSTRSRSNPSGTAIKRCSVRTERPAATTSTSETATCAITRALAPPRQSPRDAPRAPSFSASIGAARAARNAGAVPASIAVIDVRTTVNIRTRTSSGTSSATRPIGEDNAATTARLPHTANSRPPAAPALARTRLSTSICRASRQRDAPRANRTLSSCRASPSPRELSVRLALGASRWRLARQMLVESLVLASAGAAGGLLLAVWGSRAVVAALSSPIGRVALDVPLDVRVLMFTVVLTSITAILAGTAPALRAARAAPMEALKEGARGASLGDWRGGASALVIAQVAVSLVLVVAAGLFVRTLQRLIAVPLGFDRDRVLIVNVDTARARLNPPAPNASLRAARRRGGGSSWCRRRGRFPVDTDQCRFAQTD